MVLMWLSVILAACSLVLQPRAQHFNGVIWRTDNDGAPLCGGGDSNWPYMMCWGGIGGGPKHYNCMWYTMEMLSGWPGLPRRPALSCDDIEIDCDSSFICTVLLEYRAVGPMPSFGEDADREIAAECLIKQCPREAAQAEAVLEGRPGAKCHRTHQYAGMTTTTYAPVPEAPAVAALTEAPAATASTYADAAAPTEAPVVATVVPAAAAPVGPCATEAPVANSSLVELDEQPGNGIAEDDRPLISMPTIAALLAGLAAGLVVAGYSAFKPRGSATAREVLLPRTEMSERDSVEELEAVQESTPAIAINDAE